MFKLPWGSDSPQYRIVRLEVVPVSVQHEVDESDRLTCGLPSVDQLQESSAVPLQTPLSSLAPFSFRADDAADGADISETGLDPLYLSFSYDVVFQPSPILWSERWDIYLANARDRPLIHWFSIVNSLVVLLLLSALVAMILLRVLYRDISRYNDLLADEEDAEEKGWKLLHGDVFRKPAHSTVLAALTGSGMQVRPAMQIQVHRQIVYIFAYIGANKEISTPKYQTIYSLFDVQFCS